VGWRVSEWRGVRLRHWQGGRGVSHPDQHFAVFVAGQVLGVDEFVLKRRKVVIIQVKLHLERPI
jgi:hypothetical protein